MPGLRFIAMTTGQTDGTVTPYVHDTLYASAMALISEPQ
jgi:hypothetical protein